MDTLSRKKLENVLGWLETAKQNLPAINNNAVPSDQIASMSDLVDRMQRMARSLQSTQSIDRAPRERRAA